VPEERLVFKSGFVSISKRRDAIASSEVEALDLVDVTGAGLDLVNVLRVALDETFDSAVGLCATLDEEGLAFFFFLAGLDEDLDTEDLDTEDLVDVRTFLGALVCLGGTEGAKAEEVLKVVHEDETAAPEPPPLPSAGGSFLRYLHIFSCSHASS